MMDVNFLWIMAVGGWLGFLVAFLAFLLMAELNRQSMQREHNILDDWHDAIVGKDGSQ